MKTAKEKAKEFTALLQDLIGFGDEFVSRVEDRVVKLIKEQDRDTRHIIAGRTVEEDISDLVEVGNRCKLKDRFHNIAMNTRAV